MQRTLRKILREVGAVLDAIPAAQTAAFVTAIRGSKAIFVSGRGRSGLMAAAFAQRLMQMGLRAYFETDVTCPRIGKGDLLVLCSGTGETLTLLPVARSSRRGQAKVCVITGDPASPLARMADLLLHLPLDRVPKSTQPARSLFEQALLLYLDGVVLALSQALNIDHAKVLERHTNLQ